MSCTVAWTPRSIGLRTDSAVHEVRLGPARRPPDALIDVHAGAGFADIAALKGRKDIGEQINTIIAAFAKANDLRGAI